MKREELNELGLEKDKIDAIMSIYGKSVESTKKELEDLKVAKEQATAKIAEFESKIKTSEATNLELENLKKINQELSSKIEANEKAQKEASFNNLIIDNLKNAKVVKPETLAKLLDKSKIVIEDGKIKSGLDEQLAEFKTSDPYFFGESFGNPGKQPNPEDKLSAVGEILAKRNPSINFKQ